MRAVPPHRASDAASEGDSSVGFRSLPRFGHYVLHGLDDHFLRNRRMRRVGHNDLPPSRRKLRQFRLNFVRPDFLVCLGLPIELSIAKVRR
jgi:hypothetical protein